MVAVAQTFTKSTRMIHRKVLKVVIIYYALRHWQFLLIEREATIQLLIKSFDVFVQASNLGLAHRFIMRLY